MTPGERIDGIHLVEVNGIMLYTRPGESFVDDTMSGITSNDVHADPTLSGIENHTPEEEAFVARIE
jgi:hypothetical protein